MPINRLVAAAFALGCLTAVAQVLPPAVVADPAARALQEKYFSELKNISRAIGVHTYPFHFYLSRKLDLTEDRQLASDQRAIQFDKFKGQVVLKFTGNYFASYSGDLMTDNQRARATYVDVMLPILQAAVPAFVNQGEPQAFALEISHHVRKKVVGVTNEKAENVVLILPKASAERLIAAKDEAGRRAAVLEGEAFLNAGAIMLWPENDRGPQVSAAAPVATLIEKVLPPPQEALPATVEPLAGASPETLKNNEATYRAELTKMVKDLAAPAHFVAYAPPSFITFRNGSYLQISVTTALNEGEGGSLYKMAALAFDRHIAHLIRPVMAYFNNSADFSGIDFSTSIRAGGKGQEEGSTEAVEFIFSLTDLRRYLNFDLSGQELIRSGFVLMNGERTSLELQDAERPR